MALRHYHKMQLVRGLAFPSCSSSGSPSGYFPSLHLQENPSITTLGNNARDHPAAAWRPSAFRAYHSAGGLELPSLTLSRRCIFAELTAVEDMLPNRKLMAAQFSPHGLSLVPKSILAAAATAAVSSPPVTAVQEPTNPTQQTPMQAIGINTWRRLKMKKHKIKKRRKESRMQVKEE